MKKKYFDVMACVVVTLFFSISTHGQVLNQSAGWPNANWTVTGTYSSAIGAFEADPTITANFAFDEDDAGFGSDDSIAAESPIIDLTPASTAGENWITASVSYLYRNIGPVEILEFQYYDADAASWQSWENVDLPGNDTSTSDNFCTGSKTLYTTAPLNITNFTATQLTGFKYRIFYDDDPAGSNWGWGFCFDAPTIVSAVPPCLAPTNLSVTNVAQTSADLNWTENGSATTWNVEYGPTGFAQGSGTLVSTTANPYSIASGLSSGTSYDFYVQADCGGGDLSVWAGPHTFNATYDCSTANLSITSTSGATIPCIGKATLQAVASGNGNDIYWYDAATGGNLVGIGPAFTTPVISTTTSYWASEVITSTGGGGGTLPTYCVPTFSQGCGSGDDIDDFTLTDSGGMKIIEHLASSCSPNAYGDFTNDPNLTGVLIPGNSYDFTATSNYLFEHLKIWIDFDQNGSFADAGELLYTSSTSSNTFAGTISIPAIASGATVMRIRSADFSAPTDACSSDSYGEVHDYKVIFPNVICESPRVQATATISTAGDITVTTPLPYTDTNDSANYSDPYEGAPGSACATTENYLNGNNVVYHFTAATTELVNISMSNLSGFYGGVFVYGSCADIGTTCLAGAVAGPSTTDFGITDFPVTAGEDYYIVVTSWLTPTIGYTLDIVPFDCATLEDPDGASPQDFVLGDMVSDLDVTPTRTGATLNWYSDAAGTVPIPTTEPLVDGVTYYVTQTFNGCESAPPMPITVDQIDCSTLAITATTDDTVSCKGSLTLTATSSGTGDNIYWFNAATGGDIVATGPTFQTPVLTSTTSYWAAEVFTSSGGGGGGPLPTYCVPTFTSTGCGGFGDDIDDFVLTNSSGANIIQHLGSGCSPNSYDDLTGDPNLTGVLVPGNTYNFNATHSTASGNEITIFMDLNQNGSFADAGEILFSSPTGLPGGPTIGSFTIPGSLGGVTVMRVVNAYSGPATNACNTGELWGEVHDYKVIVSSLICESPRVEVIATVNQSGDVVINDSQVNPTYTTTDNTATYGNDFTGGPGTGCDGADILNGDDVVYQYIADPTDDNILNIELSGISNPNTGMYLYASCGDVGINCIAGGTNENGLTINVDDYYVTAGTEFFIVISSASSSTNYTLTINGIDCANVGAPTVADATPYFVAGDNLDDLSVDQNQYSTGLTWYSALPPSTANEIDPATTPIVDGTTYYVTQTILGCEGVPLAITPEEFQCGNMKITAATSDFYICAPGGNVTLNAQGSGLGSNVYWYDAATGGNIVYVGNTYDVNVASTTSFWAAETYGSSNVIGVGYCVPTFSSDCGSGDDVDDFVLSIPGGAILINHLGSGCSPNGYGDFTGDPTLTATLQAGSSYDFTATSNYPSEHIKIWIDFNQNGSFADAGELLYTSSTSANTFAGTISIPAGASGTTAMRVRSADFSPPTDACSPDSFGEVHDYKVTIGSTGFFCESARTEITVTVNDQPTAAPTGNASQKFCEGATLADVVLNGNNIQWYDAATGGGAVSASTLLTDGAIYYASQTVNACESGARTEVTVYVDPVAAAPVGNINQSFYDGETIADLDVQGTNLTWYEEDGTPIADPTTFPLENYETYCVAQTPPDTCEGEMLCITVHELLGADDPLFEGLSYYPNPIRHKLFISNPAPMESVALYDLRGRKVLQQKVDGNKVALDVSGLQSGTYMLWVTIDGQTGAFKLIKE